MMNIWKKRLILNDNHVDTPSTLEDVAPALSTAQMRDTEFFKRETESPNMIQRCDVLQLLPAMKKIPHDEG